MIADYKAIAYHRQEVDPVNPKGSPLLMYYLSKKANDVLECLQKVKRVFTTGSISFSGVPGFYHLGGSTLQEVSASVKRPRVVESDAE